MPHGVTFTAVYAKNVRSRIDEHRHARFEIQRVDACADKITLLCVKHFERIFLVLFIVFAENEIHKSVVFVNDGKAVEFVVPDDVVGFRERDRCRCDDKFFSRRHKRRHFVVQRHS